MLTRSLHRAASCAVGRVSLDCGPCVRTAAVVEPVRPRSAVLMLNLANLLCLATYALMGNWVYEGYVDLWYGVYGINDDDDE